MDEIQKERWQLASERVKEIAGNPEVDGKAGVYFQKTAEFLLLMLEAKEKAESGALKEASLKELKAWNDRLYGDLAGDAYIRSYGNPAYAVAELTGE